MIPAVTTSESLYRQLITAVTNRLVDVTLDILNEMATGNHTSHVLGQLFFHQEEDDIKFVAMCLSMSGLYTDYGFMMPVIGLLARSHLSLIRKLLETTWVEYASYCDRQALRQFDCDSAASLVLEKQLLHKYRRRMSV